LICTLLRVLASGDSSVALVAAMHPAVLSTAGWLDDSVAPQACRAAWEAQRAWVFDGIRNGCWWGTIVSESGTGGDVRKTRAIARRVPGADHLYRLSGDKQFGSGSGVTSFMITSALPEGEDEADIFFIDMRGVPWDGSVGVQLLAAWDGHGMVASQSHAFRFRNFPATRVAWPVASRGGGVQFTGGAFFVSVIVGIVEIAVDTARRQLADRQGGLSAYALIEWPRVETEAWLVQQAYEGLLRAIEAETDVATTARLAKLAIAELAESALCRICRLVGASSYSRHSPFGHWLEDVRALGFLRPPWGLAHELVAAESLGGQSA
jgi:alkylation response protein AidB-like acyl-CoA dehydrogenase